MEENNKIDSITATVNNATRPVENINIRLPYIFDNIMPKLDTSFLDEFNEQMEESWNEREELEKTKREQEIEKIEHLKKINKTTELQLKELEKQILLQNNEIIKQSEAAETTRKHSNRQFALAIIVSGLSAVGSIVAVIISLIP